LGFSIGYFMSRGFKEIDHKVMETPWYSRRSPFTRWFVKQLLNVFHHFQIGILLIILSYHTQGFARSLLWRFGAAMVLDDAKDIPPRFRKHVLKVLAH